MTYALQRNKTSWITSRNLTASLVSGHGCSFWACNFTAPSALLRGITILHSIKSIKHLFCLSLDTSNVSWYYHNLLVYCNTSNVIVQSMFLLRNMLMLDCSLGSLVFDSNCDFCTCTCTIYAPVLPCFSYFSHTATILIGNKLKKHKTK